MSHESWFCNPQLLDPLTVALSFMATPGHFRGCSSFTLKVWEHAVFLEGELSVAYLKYQVAPGDIRFLGARRAMDPKDTHAGLLLGEKCQLVDRCVPLKLDGTPAVSYLMMCGEPAFHIVLHNLPCRLKIAEEEEIERSGDVGKKKTKWSQKCFSSTLLNSPTCAESVTVRKLHKLREVGPNFVSEWPCLKELILEDLPELTTIDSKWAAESHELKNVSFKSFLKLEQVHEAFLYNCNSLTSVEICDLPELTTVMWNWISDCKSLQKVVIENLPKLKTIDDYCLRGCEDLRHVRFAHMPELWYVGDFWLNSCAELRVCSFENLPLLRDFGRSPLQGVGAIKFCVDELDFRCLDNCHQVLHELVARCDLARRAQ